MKQVDAVRATDTIALAAYKYYSDKKDVMKPHQIYGFGGDPDDTISVSIDKNNSL